MLAVTLAEVAFAAGALATAGFVAAFAAGALTAAFGAAALGVGAFVGAFCAAGAFFVAGAFAVPDAAVRGAVAGVVERAAFGSALDFGLLSAVGVRVATGSSPPLAGRGGRRVDRLLELLALQVQHLELALELMDVLVVGLLGADTDE